MKRIVKEQWDKIARLGKYRRKLGVDLGSIIGDRRGLKILDVGSGAGQFGRELSKYGEVVSSDVSFEMLKSGSVKDAVSCDACNLSFKSGSFDVVTSFGVFHHMPTRKDRLKFLREVSRVLVDGGIGIIRFGFLLGVNDEDVKVKWAGDVNRYYHSISYDELLALVQKIVESGNFNSYNISSSEFSHKEVLVKGTHSVYRSRFGNYLVILRK